MRMHASIAIAGMLRMCVASERYSTALAKLLALAGNIKA